MQKCKNEQDMPNGRSKAYESHKIDGYATADEWGKARKFLGSIERNKCADVHSFDSHAMDCGQRTGQIHVTT